MIQTSFVNLSRNTVPIFLGIDGYDGKSKEARNIFLEEGTHDICRYSVAFSIEEECLSNGIYYARELCREYT